jgi:hypothetical protein
MSAEELKAKAQDLTETATELRDALDRLEEVCRADEPGECSTRNPGLSRTDALQRTSAVYQGRRDPTAPVGEECTVRVNGEQLDARYDLLSASPSGFEWAYGGSGPAQLAIAILANAFDDEFAYEYYQEFKREFVSELPEDGWTLTRRDLDAWREEVTDDA